jgi:voltage-gated potassium channel
MLGLALVSATAAYLAEHRAQPEVFGSIPAALWWAITTLTTVGYGDAVPVTVIGRLIGAVVMVLGLAMFALPIGIVATAFAREMHSRDFVVTWGMVARVPLFSELTASEIATVMKLLYSRKVPAGTVIVEKGEAANSMYFVASGEVQIELGDAPVVLEEGSFFGEVAVLRKSTRSATVTARTNVGLLELEATALHKLMEQNPEIARQIRQAAHDRVDRERVTPRGDIVTEELPDA